MTLEDMASLSEIPMRFRERYRELYGVAPTGSVEYAAFRVRLRLPVDRPPLVADREAETGATQAIRSRLAFFGPSDPVETKLIARAAFASGPIGEVISGPAVVEGPVDTTVVPPGWTVSVDQVGSLQLRRAADETVSN